MQWVQAQLCGSNRLDLRSKWIEELLFENQSKKTNWNEDTIWIKKIEFYIVPLKNYPRKGGVRLFGKQPEWPLSLPSIPDFCSLKKHVLSWAYSTLIFSIKKLHWILWHVILRYIQILYVSFLNPVAAVTQPQKSETESWILWWPSYGLILKVINIFCRVYVYFCSR